MQVTPDVLLATESGVIALTENDGSWQRTAAYLNGMNVTALALQSPNVFLATSDNGGLFRIDMLGGNATRLGVGVLPDKLHALTIVPGDPKKVYVGSEPAGFFFSHDGGETWSENTGVREIAAAAQWKYPVPTVANHIRHILVSWDDPRRIFAAVPVGGILRSEDGGDSWTVITEGLDPDVHSLLQHPAKSEIVFAIAGGGGPVGTPGDYSTYGAPLPMGRPFYRSRDFGQSWECISTQFTRCYGISMGAVPTTPTTLVGPVARDIPPFWGTRPDVGADAVIMLSKDDGTTWEQCPQGLPQPLSMMIEAVQVDRKHRNKVFVGTGRDRMKEAGGGSGSVYVCDDVYEKWTRVPLDLPGISAIVTL